MNMTISINDDLANTCASTQVQSDHQLLIQKLLHFYPELNFVHVLTRGGWYRSAGIVDAKKNRIADNCRQWLETESNGDVHQLIDQYIDSDYIATAFVGKTHYFVAQTGDAASDFVQLQVEELQEVKHHLLFNENSLADDIEDIIDPVDVEKLVEEPIAEPRYLFRRITLISDFIQSMAAKKLDKNKMSIPIQRFMQDWDRSSSKEARPLCHYWVLSLQQHTDPWGEPIMQAKPVSTYNKKLPLIKVQTEHRGSELARLVHGFDHTIGYPMAWYFFMLSHSEVPHQLAEAIHKDLMGAYDYLPARDLKVLKDWSEKPYGI